MKISIISGFNCNTNNIRQRQQSPSFGRIILSEDYKNDLIKNATETDAMAVYELSQKPIDLKKLLHYDEAIPEKKKLLDKYFSALPEEEVNDLTVNFDEQTNLCPYYNRYVTNSDEALQTGNPKYIYFWHYNMDSNIRLFGNHSVNVDGDGKLHHYKGPAVYRRTQCDLRDCSDVDEVLDEAKRHMFKGVEMKHGRNGDVVPIINNDIFENIVRKISDSIDVMKYQLLSKEEVQKIEAYEKAELESKLETKRKESIENKSVKNLKAKQDEIEDDNTKEKLKALFAQ